MNYKSKYQLDQIVEWKDEKNKRGGFGKISEVIFKKDDKGKVYSSYYVTDSEKDGEFVLEEFVTAYYERKAVEKPKPKSKVVTAKPVKKVEKKEEKDVSKITKMAPTVEKSQAQAQ